MKAKHALFLLASGFCLEYLGTWLKSVHWANGDGCLAAGMLLKIAGIILLVYKLVSYPGWKNFWNR